MQLDAIDVKILQLIQENAQLTIKEIARQINLSMTPTHDRIKRLEQEEIIEKYVTILNRKKLGNPLMVYCSITLDKQQKNQFVEFEEAIRQYPEVIECCIVSGNYDYLIKVIAKDMEAYNDFYQRKLSALASVAHISSSFVMSEVKTTTVIPL
ncbi:MULTISPECIES: Lrp/AsnC family transcriptional regulator [Flectobacillus]|uniref:Lrp/AsnC family transcriptional regulator n=2 Tax=Flectobacillus TaxID=101 RepID=A0ABT6Z244_9BACT|nr:MULTISPECIES: Lrp/AsnC family transcriptional regulator [Flectobacillus]MDI9858039.1 Lrp/AsnC family transcriptional regulator [Flectobacillus roseus]MDI9871762.1 Lrp/AsnC family transcriptional regulator [Flectobacillus roseus]MDI9875095.1 Lrp/AsnC family transcriptional regulator [Flectobacillus rivi]